MKQTGKMSIDLLLDNSGCESLLSFFQQVIDDNRSSISTSSTDDSPFNVNEIITFLAENEDYQNNSLTKKQWIFGMGSEELAYATWYLKKGLDEGCFFPADFITIALPTRKQQYGKSYKTVTIYCDFLEK